jgi:hypothetical protein
LTFAFVNIPLKNKQNSRGIDMIRKIPAAIVALAMAVSILPTGVSAQAPATASASELAPQVTTENQLKSIKGALSDLYKNPLFSQYTDAKKALEKDMDSGNGSLLSAAIMQTCGATIDYAQVQKARGYVYAISVAVISLPQVSLDAAAIEKCNKGYKTWTTDKHITPFSEKNRTFLHSHPAGIDVQTGIFSNQKFAAALIRSIDGLRLDKQFTDAVASQGAVYSVGMVARAKAIIRR